MQLNCNSQMTYEEKSAAVAYALKALRRDMNKVLIKTEQAGANIRLVEDGALAAEAYRLYAQQGELLLASGSTLGFVYGLYEISRRFLGVEPFWFWNDLQLPKRASVVVEDDFAYTGMPARVRFRGWFINDETLLSHWKVERSEEMPFIMAFEALLRLGGNMVIPGTGSNSVKYRQIASDMGLAITHHHAEPLGAEMFAHAYPELEAKFSLYPEKFRELWAKGIQSQSHMPVVWNVGFRGQGDRPFWSDDPQYDTPEKRGELMSALIMEQYNLVQKMLPGATCCTNLYGETMELYQQGHLRLPKELIKIWADNGFGRMVSRRQGNSNPRVPALPKVEEGQEAHGLYYHVSFYDLQAASHITWLPNSAAFVKEELTGALNCGVDDYWIINCSNVKPHTYLLDFIGKLWQSGEVDVKTHCRSYTEIYYGKENAGAVAACIKDYAEHAISYGKNADDHAGDQFYHHVPRILISQLMRDKNMPSKSLRWLCDIPSLQEQIAHCGRLYEAAAVSYEKYLRQCEHACADLTGASRVLFRDSILMQAQMYDYWARAASFVCKALACALQEDYRYAFYYAGWARKLYNLSYRCMEDREHGKWIDFYKNECQTDIRQSAQLCSYLMSYVRNLGEGPHFWEWMREFMDTEEERRVLLILNVENHPTDDELWRLMEQKIGG